MDPDSLYIAQLVAERIAELQPSQSLLENVKTIMLFLNPIILTFGGMLLNWYLKKRETKIDKNLDTKLDIKIKILKDQQTETEKTLNEQERVFNSRLNEILDVIKTQEQGFTEKLNTITGLILQHLNEDRFRQEYRKKIIGISHENIDNPLLDMEYKSAIVYWSKLVTDFGMTYYYSDVRKKTLYERNKHLYRRRDEILKEFKEYLEDSFTESIPFYDFLDKSKVFNSFEILIDELAKNGWSDDELIEKFENQIRRFSDSVITASVVWEKEIRKVEKLPGINYND